IPFYWCRFYYIGSKCSSSLCWHLRIYQCHILSFLFYPSMNSCCFKTFGCCNATLYFLYHTNSSNLSTKSLSNFSTLYITSILPVFYQGKVANPSKETWESVLALPFLPNQTLCSYSAPLGPLPLLPSY